MKNTFYYAKKVTVYAIVACALAAPAFAFADTGACTTQNLVSDASFSVVSGGNAVVVTPTATTNQYWTATVPQAGAQWIWNIDPVVTVLTSPDTETFQKHFTIDDASTASGTISIAADDHYNVTINGHQIGADSYPYQQSQAYVSSVTYPLDSSVFTAGDNVISVSVTNDPFVDPSAPAIRNPGGLLLGMTYGSCSAPVTPTASSTIVFGATNDVSTTTDSTSTIVDYTLPTATENSIALDPNDITCAPASGSLFDLGTTPVMCTASSTDAIATTTFNVIVSSSTTPITPITPVTSSTTIVFASTTDVSTSTDSTTGMTVDFAIPTATEGTSSVPVVCSPDSGTNFDIGTTAVTCTATDPSDATNTATTTFNVIVSLNATSTAPVAPTIVSYSSGGGGGFYGGNSIVPIASSSATSTGNGISTTTVALNSCPLITSYMKLGWNNDPSQVLKLQAFLKDVEGLNVAVTGTFDASTQAAVEAFQAKFLNDIMGPWKSSAPSGIVYITTKKKINEIACDTTINLTPAEAAIIATYDNNLNAATQTSTTGVAGSTGNNQFGPGNATTSAPVGTAPTGTSTEPLIGSNPNTGAANTASVVNAPSIGGFWNWLKSIF
jgi:hypothetical protein